MKYITKSDVKLKGKVPSRPGFIPWYEYEYYVEGMGMVSFSVPIEIHEHIQKLTEYFNENNK